MTQIREADGIRFELDRTIIADARSTVGDVNIVSHAHSDHITSDRDADIVCTPLTAAL